MNRYQLAVRTSNVTTGQPAIEILGGPMGCRVYGIKIVTASAAPTVLGLGTPAALGDSPATPTTLLSPDNDQPSLSRVATAWGTSPTAPTKFSERITLPSAIGAIRDLDFPGGMPIAPKSSVVLHNITGGALLDVTIDIQENINSRPSYLDLILRDTPVAFWRLSDQEGYASAVLADAPVGYFRMDAPSGITETDRSTSGNNGTYNGSFALNQAGALSDGDPAVTFSAGNGYLDMGNTAVLRPTAAFTVEAWINLNAGVFPDGTTNWIIYDWQVINASGFAFRVDGGTAKLFAVTNQAGANTSKLGNTALVRNQWYHVAFTFDGTTGRLYINGVEDANGAFNAPILAANNVFISRNIQGMVGGMDEVAVFNYALSPTQIAQHYALRTSTVTGLVFPAVSDSVHDASTYLQRILADTPIGFYRMHATSGGVEPDLGSGAHNAAYNALFSLNQAGALSDGDPAVLFTASGTGVTDVGGYATAITAVLGQTWTVECWVKRLAVPSGANVREAVSVDGLEVYLNPADTVVRVYATAPGQTRITGTVNVANNAWHHIVVTSDAASGATKLYVDGVQDGATYAGTINIIGSVLNIGRWFGGGYTWDGNIDEVAIYNYVMSATRVASHYARRTTLDRGISAWPATVRRGSVLQQRPGMSPFDDHAAVKFDGATGSFIETNDIFNYPIGLGPLSVEFWFKVPSVAAQWGILDDKDAGSNTTGFNVFFVDAGATLDFRIANGVAQCGINTNAGWADNKWHHFVGVLARGAVTDTMTLYIDGRVERVTTDLGVVGWNLTSAIKFRMGAYTTGGFPNAYTGYLSDVAIYNSALTAAQVNAHFLAR